ncbi:MAG: hypothetical protein ACE5OO_00825 [Candidatus Bathyarchaeia archaeon]
MIDSLLDQPSIPSGDLLTRQHISEGLKVLFIRAVFNNGYSWSSLLKSINKYGQLLYEAYWYELLQGRRNRRSIRRGEYRVETKMATRLKRSLTWLQKNEDIIIEVTEEGARR